MIKSDKTGLRGKKLKLAELLANPEFNGTNKALYEMLGISHQTFYKWIKEDEVLQHAEKLIEKYTDAELAAVWKSLLWQCKKGDIQAIKLYFELKGKYKSNVELSGDFNFSIEVDYGDEDAGD